MGFNMMAEPSLSSRDYIKQKILYSKAPFSLMITENWQALNGISNQGGISNSRNNVLLCPVSGLFIHLLSFNTI